MSGAERGEALLEMFAVMAQLDDDTLARVRAAFSLPTGRDRLRELVKLYHRLPEPLRECVCQELRDAIGPELHD